MKFLILAVALSTLSFTAAHADETAAAEYVALKDQNAAFFDAAKSDDLAALKKELQKGTPINAQDSRGYTALIYAAYHGNKKAVDFLLKQGADPCAADKRGNTAMMGAVFKGNLQIAKTLLQSDCAVNQANKADQTPLMYASLFGRNEIGKELIKKGADPQKKDQLGNDARSLAEGQGNTEMVKILDKPSAVKAK